MSTPSQSVTELQEKLAGQAIVGKKFGTFAGVFTPTLLTILGVIMYLREGWGVGNAGLPGAWLVILVACSITACTGLAMSSITTNIRMGAAARSRSYRSPSSSPCTSGGSWRKPVPPAFSCWPRERKARWRSLRATNAGIPLRG